MNLLAAKRFHKLWFPTKYESVLAIKLDLAGPEPRMLHLELGYRDIGDTQHSALGLVFPVRWWYERPRGSDIWYERRHRRREDEYEGGCVPVTPTYLPRSARRQDRIILWNTTEVEGMRGVNDLVILPRSLLQYNTTFIDGHPLEMLIACTEFGRHRGEQRCLSSGYLHHPNCIRCECRTPFSNSDDVDDKRDASAQYVWSNEPGSSLVQVGDGSVTAANTPSAKGGWAFQAVMGQLHTALISPQLDVRSKRFWQVSYCTVTLENKSAII
ncbi:LOW QUALITY PROTEIN: hypothetical protein PHMEG_00028238 [Phytophthora megakarya]|uniref:Uncharacterized protein n=1 Tax=Phytophthora megakarya TaxID=4795 RepID=A0A225V5F2_9STRA|nr:LOW QUALITY PROTEIN: hypothetical protein PHMEG_00028238 [Phytophthora megakarya]